MHEAAAAVSIGKTSARAKVAARRLGLVALAGLLGTAAFPLAFPVGPRQELLPSGVLEPLAFVCLLPVLFAIRGLGARKSFGWGFFAGMFFFTAVFWWVNVAMTTFGGMPNYLSVPALLLLAAWCAFHWGLAFGVSRQIQKGFGWPLGAILPPVWMASELMRNYFCSGFPWGNLGYSQMRNLWLSQVGSLAGVYGVAFLVALANGALYEILRWRPLRERGFPKRLALAAASLLVLGHAWGAYRVARYDALAKSAPTVTVAVVQGNIDQRLKNIQGSMARMVLEAYNPPTGAADATGADLITWPEAAFPLAFVTGSTEVPWRGAPLGLGLAREHYSAHLLLGVDVWDPSDRRHGNENAAYLVSPDRKVLAQYTKHHLVPFGEYVLFDLDKYLPIGNLVPGTFKAGKSLVPMDVPLRGRPGSVKVGPEICFDAIFPEISRAYAKEGAQLLVNMTNDAWYGFSSAPFQFLRMVAMRSVETGLPVARAANTGISAFIDPVGRISDATAVGLVNSELDAVDAALRVPSEHRVRALPLAEGRTPYVVIGDVPAYLASLFSIVAFALAIARGRAQNHRPHKGTQES
jgi:apolipoprotein N-acyltransferase